MCEFMYIDLRVVNSRTRTRTRTRLRMDREKGAGRRWQRTELGTVLIVNWKALFVCICELVCVCVYMWTCVCVCVDVNVWSMARLWPRLHCCGQTSQRTHTQICSQLQCCRHVRTVTAQLYFRAIRQRLLFEENKRTCTCYTESQHKKKKLALAANTHGSETQAGITYKIQRLARANRVGYLETITMQFRYQLWATNFIPLTCGTLCCLENLLY